MSKSNSVFKVLSLDGGGMRGYYSSYYLDKLNKLAINKFHNTNFDLCKRFNMLVGTSTGAIIACGIANKMELNAISSIYKKYGMRIFPKKIPTNLWHFLKQPLRTRASINKAGSNALLIALKEAFRDKTLKQIYHETDTALVIPSVDMTTHKSYIFKTPHNIDTNSRDDHITLVDACMASSAAPVYRSLASVDNNLFADGGLYANNPILIALSEALRLTKDNGQKIEIYCLGLSTITGRVLNSKNPHWGYLKWKFGSKAINLSINCQEFVFDYLARELSKYIDRDISIIRFPQIDISDEQSDLLDLDNASEESLEVMEQLADRSIDRTNILMSDESDLKGRAIKSLLNVDKNGGTNV